MSDNTGNTEEISQTSYGEPKQPTVDSTPNAAFEANETPPPPSYDQAQNMQQNVPIKSNAVGPAPMPQPMSAQPVTVQPVTANPVVVVAPTTVNSYMLGSYPTMVTCPYCHQTGQTLVEKRTGGGNWIGVGILCLFPICWAGCQFIPLCIDDLKDAHHRCQYCHVVIGVKSGGF